MTVTFITGNPHKAELFAKFVRSDVKHRKIDLDEIQSLSLKAIVKHKLIQAYAVTSSPVLVEDTGYTLAALGKLPGPFVKWFLQEVGLEGICRLLDGQSRKASADICFGYYDGQLMKFFEGSVAGTVPDHPRGHSGFGWNSIFIPEGLSKTYAQMNEAESEKYSFRNSTVYPKLRELLAALDKHQD